MPPLTPSESSTQKQLAFDLSEQSGASIINRDVLPEVIIGPASSGKTRALLDRAGVFFNDGYDVLCIALTRNNQRSIETLWKEALWKAPVMADETLTEEATNTQDTGGQFECITWGKFYQRYLSNIPEHNNSGINPGVLLTLNMAQVVLARLIGVHLNDPFHPHYYAARQDDFQQQLAVLFLNGNLTLNRLQTLPKDTNWLLALKTDWDAICKRKSYASWQQLIVEPARNRFFTDTQKKTALLVDEAQKLSRAQWDFLSVWQQQAPQLHRVVLAANPSLYLPEQPTRQESASIFEQPIFEQIFNSLSKQIDTNIQQLNPCDFNHDLSKLTQWLSKGGTDSLDGVFSNSKSDFSAKLTVHLFEDMAQEAKILSHWIAKLVQEKTPVAVWENNQAISRAIRWSDVLILSSHRAADTVLVDALQQAGIPVHPENIPLDLLDIQTALYDSVSLFSIWRRLSTQTGRSHASLFSSASGHSIELSSENRELLESAERHWERLVAWQLPDLALQLGRQEHASNMPHPISLSAFSIQAPVIKNEPTRLSGTGIQTQAEKLYQAALDMLGQWDSVNTDILLAGWVETLLRQHPNQEKLSSLLKSAIILPLSRLVQAIGPISPEELQRQFLSLWKTPDQSVLDTGLKRGSAVSLMRHYQAHGRYAPVVCLPFSNADAAQRTSLFADLLGHAFGDAPSESEQTLNQTNDNRDHSGWRLLAFGVSRSHERLWLSGHQSNAQRGLSKNQPHPSLLKLADWLQRHKPLHQQSAIIPMTESKSEKPSQVYQGTLQWSSLPSQNTEEAISLRSNAVLAQTPRPFLISPSSVSVFLKCPRQFFYKHLMRLKEPQHQAASQGQLLHQVMEKFNRAVAAGILPHTLEALKEIVTQLFDWQTQQPALEKLGFQAADFSGLAQLNRYQRSDLQVQVQQSLDDLGAKGYFERYGHTTDIEAEKRIVPVSIPGIDGLAFHGILDALVNLKANQATSVQTDAIFEVIDYKFYGNSRFSMKPETAQNLWQNMLLPLEPNQATGLAVYSENPSRPKDYQLPLYYLMLQQSPDYRGRVGQTVLQIIRQAFGDELEKGATPLFLSGEDIEQAAQSHLINDLNEYVAKPLLSLSHFQPTPGTVCDYCAYSSICEAADIQGVEEGIADE